jgi:hypothetical protein
MKIKFNRDEFESQYTKMEKMAFIEKNKRIDNSLGAVIIFPNESVK